MMNPPASPSGAYSAAMPVIPEQEQIEIVALCNMFKRSTRENAQTKKKAMTRSYAYMRNRFFGDDLLPRPSVHGSDNDNNQNRPEIFIPLARQVFKNLFSQLKMTLFPTDEEYFRIRAKSGDPIGPPMPVQDPATGMVMLAEGPRWTDFEEPLTEAVKYLFKQYRISERLGEFLQDLAWAGIGVAYPSIKYPVTWTWSMSTTVDENGQIQGSYEPQPVPGDPEIDLHVWNPLHFYPEPHSKDPMNSAWGYYGYSKRHELLDNPATLNRDKLMALGTRTSYDTQQDHASAYTLSEFNDLNRQFHDIAESVKTDCYYFPYLRTDSGREFRNILFKVAEESVLIEARPNMTPGGKPPVVWTNWAIEKDSPYGTSPIEDMAGIQQLVNILYNYMIETLARIGNRFVVKEGTDMTNFFGLAGGVATANDPSRDVVPITGDYTEVMQLANVIGTLKAEGQQVAGAQTPFQGAANIDFKKTATEMQLLQENFVSVLREVTEHIAISGIQPILERLAMLAAEIYKKTPIKVRVDDPLTGTQYMDVDLSLLTSGRYTLELVTVNPGQSKQAQVTGLMEFLNFAANQPMAVSVLEPIISRLGALWGIKDTGDILSEIKQRMEQMYAAQPVEQGVSGTEDSVGAASEPGMDNADSAAA